MNVKENEPLKNHTTFRIGGAAKKFVEPESVAEFLDVIKSIKSIGEKFFILGGGSNVVFSDNGFNGTVISTAGLNKITATKDRNENIFDYPFLLTCGAGCSIANVVGFTKQNCVTGFEKFSGLPGTIGGAVYMNARCFDFSISEILESVEYLDLESLEVKEYKFEAKDWDYKKSPFQRTPTDCPTAEENQSTVSNSPSKETHNSIILSATIKLQMLPSTSDNLQKIADDCKHYMDERVSKGHFKFPSAGSVFKNNHEFGKPSGKIIDEAGLKGYQIGGAQIAPFHGNFIINTGNATADDVRSLVEFTKKTVQEKFGFSLEEEIIFVAE